MFLAKYKPASNEKYDSNVAWKLVKKVLVGRI